MDSHRSIAASPAVLALCLLVTFILVLVLDKAGADATGLLAVIRLSIRFGAVPLALAIAAQGIPGRHRVGEPLLSLFVYCHILHLCAVMWRAAMTGHMREVLTSPGILVYAVLGFILYRLITARRLYELPMWVQHLENGTVLLAGVIFTLALARHARAFWWDAALSLFLMLALTLRLSMFFRSRGRGRLQSPATT